MAPVPDPYRILGLGRGATLDEVKRAYRRLAKEHHPDSGGERALPRFLEIQAAYEQLLASSGGGTRAGQARAGAARAHTPWQADDTRAEATRRAYGARTRRSTGRAGSGAPQGAPPAGPGPRPTGEPSGDEPRRRRTRRDRPPNKATFGSTTYDGVDGEPFEPGWTGASWYGTSSGTYWTLNPREYADPRKHGPEYQARARRARADAAARGDPDALGGTESPESDPSAASADPAAAAAGATDPEPPLEPDIEPEPAPVAPDGADVSADTEPGATWWTAARSAAEPGDRRIPPERSRPGDDRTADLDPLAFVAGLVRRLIEDPPTRPPARLATALAGGAPLAFGLAWLLGELSGCGRFAATCDPAVVALAGPAGIAIVAVLVLLPGLASLASVGSIALVLAGVPATIFLAATGGSRVPDASGALLGIVLALAWLVGAAFAAVRRRRLGGARRPVS